MEWIEGKSCYEYLFQRIAPADFERMFFHILFQLSFLLHTIQKHLPLDHRDMKLDNLWIVEAPVKYTVHLPAIVPTTYTAPIRVVLLDFGFACLGTAEQTTVLNLGNVIPDVDPCPKEGRDLYHILNRMLEPPAARQALSSSALELFERWMAPYGRSRHSETHILTSYPHFAIPSLHPTNFLRWFLETRYFEN
jgi:serine/threonine protein kinase